MNTSKSIEDVTDNDHPHIRGYIKLKKSSSQFKVSFFLSIKIIDKDFWNRFHQPYDKQSKKLRDEDVLGKISENMYDQFGYRLDKSAGLYYDNSIFTGRGSEDHKEGYCLDFYFSK